MHILQLLHLVFGCYVALYFNHAATWPYIPFALFLALGVSEKVILTKLKPFHWIFTAIHAIVLFVINLQIPLPFVIYAIINMALFLAVAINNAFREQQARVVI